MQYFSKKKLVLPEGYFVNSSQIPLAKEVNKLLANCGCETFPIKPLSELFRKVISFLPYRMNQRVNYMAL